jgi:hypothetical protein
MPHAAQRTLLLMAILSLSAACAAAAEPAQRLQRASGLWKVTPATSPFSWEICVHRERDRLIEDDLWTDFEQEVHDRVATARRRQLPLRVQLPRRHAGGRLQGDLDKAYTLRADTTLELNGKTQVQRTELAGEFLGACPVGLAPGAKKMRGGMVMKSLYDNR